MGLAQEGEQVTEDSSSKTIALGMELKPAGGGERTWGSTDKTSYVLSWKSELEFSGAVGGLNAHEAADRSYAFMPYVWLQRITSSGGVNQAFMVLDYWVSDQGAVAAAMPATPDVPVGPAVTPGAPVIDSTTHPDPNTWYPANSATFTWAQPAGDATDLSGYRWYLDQEANTVPATVSPQMTTTFTYAGLADGVWTMHLHAASTGGQWSAVTHRTIRVDANSPTVTLSLDPAAPSGHNGWYVAPVTAAISSTDGAGSGVAAIEVSTDKWHGFPTTARLPSPPIRPERLSMPGARPHGEHVRPNLHHLQDRLGCARFARGERRRAGSADRPDYRRAAGQPGIAPGRPGRRRRLGRAGMRIGVNGLDWTAASYIGEWQSVESAPGQPPVQVN